MLLDNEKIQIINTFLRDYTIKTTGSEIARKNKLNQKTVSNVLKKLEQEYYLKSKTQGKNKLYSLNLDDSLIATTFILTAEYQKTISFYKKKPFIKEIISKIIPYIKGIVIVFGSYAKNIEKEGSDLDILIIGNYNKKEIHKIAKTYKIEINIKQYSRLPKKTDPLMQEVIKDHILIQNAQKFIMQIIKWKK